MYFGLLQKWHVYKCVSKCEVFSLIRHQGFGVLSVILANHSIKLLTSLFQDLQVEALHRVRLNITAAFKLLEHFCVVNTSEAVFCLPGLGQWRASSRAEHHAQSTSIQRVQRLIDSVPLTNLLFTLLSTSYKKVCDHRTWSWLLWGSGLLCLMNVVPPVLFDSGVCAAAAEKRFGQQWRQCLHWLQHLLRRWLQQHRRGQQPR